MKKTALITGTTNGIGWELAKIFASNGFNLVLVARSKNKLEVQSGQLKKEYGVEVNTIISDLANPASPEQIYNEVVKMEIQVDFLVNNAGTQVYGLFYQTDIIKELELININLVSLTHLTKLFLPDMVERGFGKILNLGSTGSFAPGPFNSVYCATKAYVLSFSEALAEELKGTGVTVTALCPGATQTEFAKKAQIEDTMLFRYTSMDARAVAETGYKAMIKGKMVVIPGAINKLQVFSIRLSPRKIVAAISKKLLSKK